MRLGKISILHCVIALCTLSASTWLSMDAAYNGDSTFIETKGETDE